MLIIFFKINNLHANVRFTIEVKFGNKVSFFTVPVTQEQTGISSDLFQKKTFTGLYTDLASLTPDKDKINLVLILVFCIFHRESI